MLLSVTFSMSTPPPLPTRKREPGKSSALSEDARELLGIGKDDWWCYAGWIFLAAGCFLDNSIAILALFLVSCVFVGIFLMESYPRYVKSKQLSPWVRTLCILGNVFVIALQGVTIAIKCWLHFKS